MNSIVCFALGALVMLEPIVKEKSVNSSEEAIAKLSESKFFSLWSYPNIYRDENIAEKGSGHEMCDFFILSGDTAIIISDKSNEFVLRRGFETAWNSWYRESIFKSCDQLFGCYKWIKRTPERVYLDKYCLNKFPFQLSQIKNFHLIAITDDIDTDRKSVGQFSYDFNSVNGKQSNTPFLIGRFKKNAPFIHVFNRSLFELILHNLVTITDFTSYLRSKEKAIENGTIIKANCEEQILAAFLRNRTEINIVGHLRAHGEQYKFSENSWSDYLYTTSEDLVNSSYNALEHILEIMSDSVVCADVGTGKDNPISFHENALRVLAEEPYISRKLLSRAFEDKFNEVPKNVRSSRLSPSLYFDDLVYVFLFVPQYNMDLEEYRKARILLSTQYATVVKYKNPQFKRVVVISTETKGHDTRSEDIIAADCSIDFNDEDNRFAEEISRQFHILTHTHFTESKGAHIYKGASRSDRLKPKYRRNDLCSCGSGIKYKYCCLNK
ncbi:TPA: SEC-C domain-containing protein [Vibrio fluvialis clinical-1]|nr:SEC-C domain-containing protein [Vibrio fluvialis]HDM8033172.1 SEC-C domain-containing protein [Vibrio fluvialis clinical-1]